MKIAINTRLLLKDKLEDVLEDARQEYEGQEITGEEVEYESRDGFIPYTDGGYEYKFFTYKKTEEFHHKISKQYLL